MSDSVHFVSVLDSWSRQEIFLVHQSGSRALLIVVQMSIREVQSQGDPFLWDPWRISDWQTRIQKSCYVSVWCTCCRYVIDRFLSIVMIVSADVTDDVLKQLDEGRKRSLAGHCGADNSFSNMGNDWQITFHWDSVLEEWGHLERCPGRGGNLTVVGLTLMWVGATLCVDEAFIDCGGIEGEPQVSIQLRIAKRTWLELAASLFVMRWCCFHQFQRHRAHVAEGRRVVQWVETTGYNSLFAIGTFSDFGQFHFSDYKHDRRRGVVFHSFCHVCLLLVSLADCEVGAARRHLLRRLRSSFAVGEKSGVVHKGSLIVFLMLYGKLLTIFVHVRRAWQLFNTLRITVADW